MSARKQAKQKQQQKHALEEHDSSAKKPRVEEESEAGHAAAAASTAAATVVADAAGASAFTPSSSSSSSSSSAPASAAAQSVPVAAQQLSDVLVKDGIKVALPAGWRCVADSVLLFHHKSPSASEKIAAFDFDGCLCNTSLGFDPNAWKIRYPSVPERLRGLHAEGFKIVIFTNESIDRFKSSESVTKAVVKKTSRLMGFAAAVDVPIQMFCMLKKDTYRKPLTGVWDLMTSQHNEGKAVVLKECFFVGDAAGRPRDHDDCDKMFAHNVGITFHTDDGYFKGK